MSKIVKNDLCCIGQWQIYNIAIGNSPLNLLHDGIDRTGYKGGQEWDKWIFGCSIAIRRDKMLKLYIKANLL